MPADRTEQSAYERICAEACEWCKAGSARIEGPSVPYHYDDHCHYQGSCAAPPRADVIEHLAAELATAKAQITALMPLHTDQPIPAEELIAIGKGLRDLELEGTVPIEEVRQRLTAELARVTKERDEANAELAKRKSFMDRAGFRVCDIAACNCDEWHNPHMSALSDALDERVSELAALKQERDELRADKERRPKIICLCGPTRFIDTWINEYQRLSDEGNIVLTVARMPPRPNLQHDEPALKIRLDELHKRKIDLADEVFVLNVEGYIGDSTRGEIAYAEAHGKPVLYLDAARTAQQDVNPGAQSRIQGVKHERE